MKQNINKNRKTRPVGRENFCILRPKAAENFEDFGKIHVEGGGYGGGVGGWSGGGFLTNCEASLSGQSSSPMLTVSD